MPDFKAEASSTESRDPVPSSDAGAPARSGGADVKVVLGLLAVALLVKFAVFGVSVGTSMGLSIPNGENWQDFSLAYMPAAEAFKSGFLPYNDFFYAYPPLFLYAQAAFSYLPLPSWSGAIPLVAADALTAVPVYLIARRLGGERSSLLLSALFIMAPTNLYYADYLWLNPPLTTLFLMASLYFLIERRYDLSALTLAISFGFKQTALFALPVIVLVVWKGQMGRSGAIRYLLIAAAASVLFSIPYLYVSPGAYLASIFRVPMNWWDSRLPPNYFQIGVGTGTQVSFNTLDWLTSRWALLSAGVYSPVTLILPLFLFLMPTSLLAVYDSQLLFNAGVFFLATGLLIFFIVLRWRPKVDVGHAWKYVLCAMLFAFALYPLYKYYVVGIIPLLVLLVRGKKDALGFLAFSFALILVPRYFASWVLLGSFIWLFRGDLARLLLRGARGFVGPLASDSDAGGGDGGDDDDSALHWRGRPISRGALFGAVTLAWFLLLLLMLWPRSGMASVWFFVTGGISAIYLTMQGPRALTASYQNTFWLGMLWGYDLPFVVIASLVLSGFLRF